MSAARGEDITRSLAGGANGCDASIASSPEAARAKAVRLAAAFADLWRTGEGPPAAEIVTNHPELAFFPDAVRLIAAEESRCRQGPSAAFLRCGQWIAGCYLRAELGTGVYGQVFLATQPELADRPVVLKISRCEGEEHLALARLFHAHIVPLLFVQEIHPQNLRVLGMPYLGGCTIQEILRLLPRVPPRERTGRSLVAALDTTRATAPMPAPHEGPNRALLERASYPDAVCWLGGCLAEALHFAHERNLVHLDIKPANILLGADAQPWLLDFHLARAPLPIGAPPPPWFGGTPIYMAPEQRESFDAVKAGLPAARSVDGRADVFALGAVLFEMLAGRPPVPEDRDPRRELRRLNPEVSPGLGRLIAKCLELEPDHRYADAKALAADLRRHLAHEPLLGVRNRSLSERVQKWRRRHPQGLLGIGALLLTLTALARLLLLEYQNVEARWQEGESALVQGQALVAQQRPREAEEHFSRGLEKIRHVPWSSGLAKHLDRERQRARTARMTGELAAVVEELRFIDDPERISVPTAAGMGEKCQQLWRNRVELLNHAEIETEAADRVRTDLKELAILWADVALRAAPASMREAERRRVLAVLVEAKDLDKSAILDLEIERHRSGSKPSTGTLPSSVVPQSPWEQYALGRWWLRHGQIDRAAEAFAKAVNDKPEAFWPNFYRGVCAYRQSRHEIAAAAFQVCVALAPRTAACYYNRALARAALGQTPEAMHDLDRAIRLQPRFGAALLERGILHFRGKRFDEALSDLERAGTYGADPAIVHFNLALLYHARNERTKAIFHARAALAVRPNHAATMAVLERLKPAANDLMD